MINIEYIDNVDKKLYRLIDTEFNKFAKKNEITCDYKLFTFVAKEDENVIGIITGNSYYDEVHIADLIVLEEYRNKHIGSKLIKTVEDYHKEKGFKNLTLSTYEFQAPEFYKKCGFEIEFVRKNKDNKKLNKYFFIKKI